MPFNKAYFYSSRFSICLQSLVSVSGLLELSSSLMKSIFIFFLLLFWAWISNLFSSFYKFINTNIIISKLKKRIFLFFYSLPSYSLIFQAQFAVVLPPDKENQLNTIIIILKFKNQKKLHHVAGSHYAPFLYGPTRTSPLWNVKRTHPTMKPVRHVPAQTSDK